MEVVSKTCNQMHSLKTLKSRISPVVKSRGARFLDMVRQNNLNISPKTSSPQPSVSDVLQKGLGEPKTPNKKIQPNNEFLNDNKFNPKSSPISSKRKFQGESSNNSPSMSNSTKKNKKNSPVSPASKKNLESINSNRCLKNENNRDVRENEEVILHFSDNNKVIELESSDEENPQKNAITTTGDLTTVQESQELFDSVHLIFKDKQELLDYVSKNITVDELLESLNKPEDEPTKYIELVDKVVGSIEFTDLLDKYIPTKNTESNKLTLEQNSNISCIINKISKMMQANNTIKHKVLDILSEKHSSEFLEHTLQENSTNSICEKLSMKNVVNYIIHKVNVGGNDDTEMLVKKLNVSLIHQLVNNTVHKLNNDKEILCNDKEIQELLTLLFTNKPKIDVFDALHEFLRQIVKNN